MRRLVRFGIVSSAVAALAACVSKLDIPTPPMQAETQAIVAEYERPTGSVDIGLVQAVLDAVNVKLPNLNLDWLPNFAADLLTGLHDRLQQSDLPDSPDGSVETHHFILSAVVNLHRICPGFDDPPGPVDMANGHVDSTGIVKDGALQPEVWGVAAGCKTSLSLYGGPAVSGKATLDGTVILYLLGPLPTSLSNARFLLRYEGQLALGNQTGDTSIDLRIFDGLVGFRVPVTDGNIVVEKGTGSSVTLRASNGTFACDLTARSCQ